MTRKPPINRNDEIVLCIDSMGSEGQGVGRYEGMAVFVPFALPGEVIKAHIIKVTSSYAVGKLVDIIKHSTDRVVADCPYFTKCGGCMLRHMSYAAQLEYKRRQVADAMERIGGFTGLEVKPTVGMNNPQRYRNKGAFPLASCGGAIYPGLFVPRSHRIIPITDCLIQNENTMRAVNAVREWANANGISAYDEKTQKGILRHIVVRSTTGGTMAVVVTNGELPQKEKLIDMLKAAVPDLQSIIHNINDRDTNVIMGDINKTIWGSAYTLERLCKLDFSVSAESFLQVNTEQACKLYDIAIDSLEIKPTELAVDLYCGIGTITLMLAKKSAKAIGIEIVDSAIHDAAENAVRNGLSNVEFICATAESALPKLVASGIRIDALSLDPPRKGVDIKALEAIIQSGVQRITYVSCNPATLARDCKILCSAGYEIRMIQPVDMFPMTAHVETIVLLQRENL